MDTRIIQLPGKRALEVGQRPCIMGIVNLTPDSFWEGSRKLEPERARDAALAMLEDGADIVDFGAESTRPSAVAVSEEEELSRLLPALRAFRACSAAPVSVDTRRSMVMRAALDEGADIINDVEALAAPGARSVAAAAHAAVILMHMKGQPRTMQESPCYDSCAGEVNSFLADAARRALDAGVAQDAIILDPGIGFGKNLPHNLELLRHLYLTRELGYPVLVGLSRKRFIGDITGRPVSERVYGSLGAACAAWAGGAAILRVHDVAATRDALSVFTAAFGGAPGGAPGSAGGGGAAAAAGATSMAGSTPGACGVAQGKA